MNRRTVLPTFAVAALLASAGTLPAAGLNVNVTSVGFPGQNVQLNVTATPVPPYAVNTGDSYAVDVYVPDGATGQIPAKPTFTINATATDANPPIKVLTRWSGGFPPRSPIKVIVRRKLGGTPSGTYEGQVPPPPGG